MCLRLKLYTLLPTLRRCLGKLERLVTLKLDSKEESREGKASLYSIRKSLSYKLNKLKSKNFNLKMLSNDKEGEDVEDIDKEEMSTSLSLLLLPSSSSSSFAHSIKLNSSIELTSIL
jgi:hypothetical protein